MLNNLEAYRNKREKVKAILETARSKVKQDSKGAIEDVKSAKTILITMVRELEQLDKAALESGFDALSAKVAVLRKTLSRVLDHFHQADLWQRTPVQDVTAAYNAYDVFLRNEASLLPDITKQVRKAA
jgi:hypothetical protein